MDARPGVGLRARRALGVARKGCLMSFQEYESLTETLDILSTPGALEQIREAEARIDAGDYATEADIRADLERRQSATSGCGSILHT